MKTTTGTPAGVLPRRIASTFGLAKGTGVSGYRLRTAESLSPLAEPGSPPEVLTV
ncbi:hypothetical protein [Actinotalea sp.]|uniref:hypothetical protein n=1 Tax=Actinotalea sp. TaxID=1872145 RepID=UPI0035629FF7